MGSLQSPRCSPLGVLGWFLCESDVLYSDTLRLSALAGSNFFAWVPEQDRGWDICFV